MFLLKWNLILSETALCNEKNFTQQNMLQDVLWAPFHASLYAKYVYSAKQEFLKKNMKLKEAGGERQRYEIM